MFVTKPRSTQAFEGDTVIIYCEVIGDPKPDVVWLRDFLKVSLFIYNCSRFSDHLCEEDHVVSVNETVRTITFGL